MYILLCGDGSYYTGSTVDLERRIAQHEAGEGANHTRKFPPVKMVYYEWYPRIDLAFNREKQVQGWNRQKKEALINGEFSKLPELAKAYRDLKPGLREPQPPVPDPDDRPTVAPKPEALEGEALEGQVGEGEAPDNEMPQV